MRHSTFVFCPTRLDFESSACKNFIRRGNPECLKCSEKTKNLYKNINKVVESDLAKRKLLTYAMLGGYLRKNIKNENIVNQH